MKGKVREEKKNKTLPFICLEMGRKERRSNPLFDLQRKKKRKRKIIIFTFMLT